MQCSIQLHAHIPVFVKHIVCALRPYVNSVHRISRNEDIAPAALERLLESWVNGALWGSLAATLAAALAPLARLQS